MGKGRGPAAGEAYLRAALLRVQLQRAKEGGEKVKRRTLKFSTGGSKGCLAGQLICLIDVDAMCFPAVISTCLPEM